MTTPMGLSRILGQTQAIGALRAGLRSGRFHHAWIFSGPKGVGKFSTAMELAAVLLDAGASAEVEPDDDGETVRRMQAGTHPDLHVIRKELALFSDDDKVRAAKQLNIPVAVLRQFVIGGQVGSKFHEGPAWETPGLGRAKVFIIDEAELLAHGRNEAQNTLLKTLEEPPSRTYIFLITSRPERLLPTIHSRCQHVHFTALNADAMDTWFKQSGLDLDPRSTSGR
jgi:DNA polymerase-3 subunit delta'